MTKSAHPERETQNRIVKFFRNELGYEYLGNLSRGQNYNVRWGDWKKFLSASGYSAPFIGRCYKRYAKRAMGKVI
jgi:type I restriction enzyme R subunit